MLAIWPYGELEFDINDTSSSSRDLVYIYALATAGSMHQCICGTHVHAYIYNLARMMSIYNPARMRMYVSVYVVIGPPLASFPSVGD